MKITKQMKKEIFDIVFITSSFLFSIFMIYNDKSITNILWFVPTLILLDLNLKKHYQVDVTNTDTKKLL